VSIISLIDRYELEPHVHIVTAPLRAASARALPSNGWRCAPSFGYIAGFNWNEPQVSCLQINEQPSTLNDTWVRAGDANGVCQGIQKVRVVPATRSAVAACNKRH